MVRDHHLRALRMSGEPCLNFQDVCVHRSKQEVLHHINLTLYQGELSVLVGPNGAGKTSLLKAACGLLPLKHGNITLNHHDLSIPLHHMPLQERAQYIAYLEQGAHIAWPLSVQEIVHLGRMPHQYNTQPIDPMGEQDIVNAAMCAVHVDAFSSRNVHTLSGGEQARVLLARALCTQAPLLFVDEPVASLDPQHQLEIMALLQAEAQKGTCVLAVMHDLTLAAQFAKRMIVMHQGRIVADGAPQDVLAQPDVARIFGVNIHIEKTQDQDQQGIYVRISRKT